jgi:hypothetical protein
VVVGFGVIFSYPFVAALLRTQPHHAPFALHLQAELGQKLITPALFVILVAGAYLASEAGAWGEFWVLFPLVSLIGMAAVGGAYLGPNEEKAAVLAERDLGAGGAGTLSEEYHGQMRRLATAQNAVAVWLLLVIFVMVAKPFA